MKTTTEAEKNLLGDGWLIRGAWVVISTSPACGAGVLQSSGIQQDLSWAVGREAFRIRPQGALKILTVYAEADLGAPFGNRHVLTRKMCKGLRITPGERKILGRNFLAVHVHPQDPDKLLPILQGWLELRRPDILRLDSCEDLFGATVTLAVFRPFIDRLCELLALHDCGAIIHDFANQRLKKIHEAVE
jgi:hypothetical protein